MNAIEDSTEYNPDKLKKLSASDLRQIIKKLVSSRSLWRDKLRKNKLFAKRLGEKFRDAEVRRIKWKKEAKAIEKTARIGRETQDMKLQLMDEENQELRHQIQETKKSFGN